MNLLSLKNVKKSFGSVDVLHGMNIEIKKGEVIGLVGDNGAGKSTLMKIITGLYTADEGEILFEGSSILNKAPGARRELGIEMIYQDLALAKQQNVAANIFLGREPVKKIMGIPFFIDKAKMDKEAREMIAHLGAKLPAIHRPVGTFSGGQQQAVAIARALTFNPKLVIMDEPTAALAVREVQGVLDLIRELSSREISVILISHRLNDVLSVTDRVVVMRQGVVAKNLTTAETNMNEIVTAIVGGGDNTATANHESKG